MNKVDYEVTFNVPAFLGDAEQKSAWRTPPFKALIQQWWRIAVAKEHDYDWHKVREAEGRLFGHAWLKDSRGREWAMRSQVRIRLAECKPGTLDAWLKDDPKVEHKEVKFKVGSQLYLGYGPLDFKKGLKNSPAIKFEEKNQLNLAFPQEHDVTFSMVMQLLHFFGTLGGRSRNGWGSIKLHNNKILDYQRLLDGDVNLTKVSRHYVDCLKEEWPHAIGKDEKGVLIWRTDVCNTWVQVMRKLAEIKIGFRTECLPFKQNKDKCNPVLDERHILSYPVTHHGVNGWSEQDWNGNLKTDKRGFLIQKHRIANQLRFKVIRLDQKFYGLIFHLPCAVPEEMTKEIKGNNDVLTQQEATWHKVHQHLDQHLKRAGSLNNE